MIELVRGTIRTRLPGVMCPSGRYHMLNLQSLARHGTLEFRYHSGSTSASKINRHIRFCIGFVLGHKDDTNWDVAETSLTDDTSNLLERIGGTVNENERGRFTRYFERRQARMTS